MVLITSFHRVSSQNYPLYDGYFLNPFIFNPAAAATERIQLNAGYRKQWFGVTGAPTISSLTVSTLINESRAGIGFKVSSISRGFLTSTDASASYAYGVPLNHTNKLFFGLSGGMLSNMINFSDPAVANDPAVKNVSTGMMPSASFGMLWKNSKGFDLGFTLPKLFSDPNLNSKYSFSYFDNAILTASYSQWSPKPTIAPKGKSRVVKAKKAKNIPLEAFAIYRYSIFGNLFEGTAKYNFSPNIWLSATYRQYSGVIPGIGIVTDNLSFSYFYEPGLGGDLPLKTHELMLNIHLGKVKIFREKAPTPPASKITLNHQPKLAMGKQPDIKPEEKKVVTPPPTPKQEVVVKKPEEKKVEPVKKEEPKVAPQVPQVAKKEPVTVDSAALKLAHAEERKQLDQHIQDHAEGKHDDAHDQPVNQRHDFVKRGSHHEELEVGTYIIAGAFQSRANAEHYTKTLKALGYDADFGHLSARKFWYVYVAEDASIPQAKKERDELQKHKIFSQVWLLTVQE